MYKNFTHNKLPNVCLEVMPWVGERKGLGLGE
jgi:hypothetical protein